MDINEILDKIKRWLLLIVYVLCVILLVVDYLSWWKVVVGGLLLVLGVWGFNFIWWLESDYDEERKAHSHYKKESNSLQEENKLLKSEIRAFKEMSNAPSKPESDKINESPKINQETAIDDGGSKSSNPTGDSQVSQTTTLVEYYTSPTSNGQFRQSQCKLTESMDCFYRIEYENGTQNGIIELLKKQNYKPLLDYKTDCLYPVCQVESQKQDAKTIVMNASGDVILKDGVWNIENGRKIKIRIE